MLDAIGMIFCAAIGVSTLYFVVMVAKYFGYTREINRRLATLEATNKPEADRLRTLESRGDALIMLCRDGGLVAKPYV